MMRITRLIVIALVLSGSASAQTLPVSIPPSSDARDPVGDADGSDATDISFPALVRDLGRSFRRLPSLSTALVLGAGGGLATWVRSEDAEVTRQWSRSVALDDFFEPGALIGNGWVQTGAAAGTFVLGHALGHHPTAVVGADLLRAHVVNTVLTDGLKVAIRRRRPDGGRYSFPSGHTSATFTTATVLRRHFGWRVGIPSYALAVYVGGSRLQENRHYLSDVLFGAAVGIVAGHSITIGRGTTRFDVSPVARPGGFAVAVTRHTSR